MGWGKKHKYHCKKIRRLQIIIDTERNKLLKSGGISLKKVMAIPQRDPTFLESGRHYKSICFYGDEQVLFGYHRGQGLKSAFVKVDDMLVNLPLRGERTSICLMSNNYSPYVVTSLQESSKSFLDFYSYRLFDCPFHGCVAEITSCLGSLSFFEGHLYAVNTVWNIIQEFQVNTTCQINWAHNTNGSTKFRIGNKYVSTEAKPGEKSHICIQSEG